MHVVERYNILHVPAYRQRRFKLTKIAFFIKSSKNFFQKFFSVMIIIFFGVGVIWVKRTCTLCTFLEYKVHLIKTGLNALVYKLWSTLYLPHHRKKHKKNTVSIL